MKCVSVDPTLLDNEKTHLVQSIHLHEHIPNALIPIVISYTVSDMIVEYFMKHRFDRGKVTGFLRLGVALDIIPQSTIDGALYQMTGTLLEYSTLDWYFSLYQRGSRKLVFTDCRRHLNILQMLFDFIY